MASFSQPRVLTYKADGSITRGKAVKPGSDDNHVAVGAANTDACIGITLDTVTAAEGLVEVCMPGGGCKALVGGSITKGNLLVSHTDGTLIRAVASGDRIVAMALESGVAGDYLAVEVVIGKATGAES